MFGPHTVFLHPEGIFSLSSKLVWLSVIFGGGWVTCKEQLWVNKLKSLVGDTLLSRRQ